MKMRLLQDPGSLASHPNWVRAAETDTQSIRGLAMQIPYSKARKLFAIVRASKTNRARRVLVFDNHPETLAYLFPPTPDQAPAPRSLATLSTWQFASLLTFICVLVTLLSWLAFFH
jgi:hypothetical protein